MLYQVELRASDDSVTLGGDRFGGFSIGFAPTPRQRTSPASRVTLLKAGSDRSENNAQDA